MSVDKRQLEFGETLRRLRAGAGHASGKDFAEALGWQPSKVSRIENGRTLPARADLDEWLDAVDAPAELADTVHDEAREIRLARDSWKRQLRRGHADRQRVEADAERHATRITSVEFFVVPGLVQTADYARAVFEMAAELHGTPVDTDDAVRERIRRQQALYDPEKRVEILVGESALRYPLCPDPVMRTQLDRLVTLAGLPNVRFGVIPLGSVLPTVTMHGYTMLDDVVAVEINHTEVVVTDPDEVALYSRITDGLWRVAAEGDDARAALTAMLS